MPIVWKLLQNFLISSLIWLLWIPLIFQVLKREVVMDPEPVQLVYAGFTINQSLGKSQIHHILNSSNVYPDITLFGVVIILNIILRQAVLFGINVTFHHLIQIVK